MLCAVFKKWMTLSSLSMRRMQHSLYSVFSKLIFKSEKMELLGWNILGLKQSGANGLICQAFGPINPGELTPDQCTAVLSSALATWVWIASNRTLWMDQESLSRAWGGRQLLSWPSRDLGLVVFTSWGSPDKQQFSNCSVSGPPHVLSLLRAPRALAEVGCMYQCLSHYKYSCIDPFKNSINKPFHVNIITF